jgi:putative membrane protein
MVDAMGWLTPIAAACLAFALFGVDEIGVEIEDPFGYDPNDLPLEAILRTIAADTREIVDAAGATIA